MRLCVLDVWCQYENDLGQMIWVKPSPADWVMMRSEPGRKRWELAQLCAFHLGYCRSPNFQDLACAAGSQNQQNRRVIKLCVQNSLVLTPSGTTKSNQWTLSCVLWTIGVLQNRLPKTGKRGASGRSKNWDPDDISGSPQRKLHSQADLAQRLKQVAESRCNQLLTDKNLKRHNKTGISSNGLL